MMRQAERISIDWEGETYYGSYQVDGDRVTVSSHNGRLSDQLRGLSAPVVARRLLRDLAQRGLA